MKLSFTIPTLICVLFCTNLAAQWQTTDGIKGGQLSGFRDLGDTLVALVPQGAVFSLDKGAHWDYFQLPEAFKNYSWATIKVQNHDLVLTNFSESLALVSRNAGQTWQSFPLPNDNGIGEFFIQGNKLGYTTTGVNGGLFHSDDWGITWTKVSNTVLRLIHVHNDTLLGIVGSKVVRSTDMGLTTSTSLSYIANIKGAVGIGSSMLFLAHEQGQYRSLHFTSDMGENWTNKTILVNGEELYWNSGEIYTKTFLDEIYRSADLGNNWDLIVPPSQDELTSIYAKDSTVLMSMYNGGYWQSRDEMATWSGPYHNLVLDMAQKLKQVDDKLVAIIPNDIFCRNGDSSTWKPMNLPYGIGGIYNTYMDIIQMDTNLVMLFDFQPYVSQDQGVTWQLCDVTHDPGLGNSKRLVKTPNRVFAPEDSEHHGMLISDDDGVTYKYFIFSEMGYLRDFNYVDGKLVGYRDQDFYTSSDEGVTWDTIPINPANVPSNFSFFKMHVIGDNIFIFDYDYFHTVESGVVFSKDYGQTWGYRDSTGFVYMYALVSVGDYLVAATEKGIFRSKDSGDTWENWSEGLPFPIIKDLIVHDGYLYCTTLRGVFRRPVGELDFVGTEWSNTVQPQALRVLPNPAKSGVYIEHPGQQGVLFVFDTNGRLVSNIATKNDSSTFMDVSNWANGHYHIVLESAQGRLSVGTLVKM